MMNKRLVLLTAIAGTAMTGTPALAQSVNDIRCVMVADAFAKSAKDKKLKRIAESTLYFYFGRVDARFNEAQMRAGLLSQRKAITRANAPQTMQGCVLNAQRSVKRSLVVGQRLAKSKR
jgi:hypothetical protein